MEPVKPVTIQAEVMWANLQEKNKLSGKYQINLSNLSQKAQDALEERGINVRSKGDQGEFITCKSNKPIRAYDTDGVELTGVLIANGSKAKAVIGHYDWTSPSGASGRSPSLMKLVITDLIEFTPEVALDEAL
jgi:hypothetical protein